MKTKTFLRSACIMLVLFLCSATAFAGILKRPYLIYEGTNTTMTVLWQDDTSEPTNVLSWGGNTSYSLGSVTVPEYGPGNQHKYEITGLQPSTRYYYEVADAASGVVYGTGSFITAPDDNATSIRFLGMGDSRSQPFALDNVMQAMRTFYSQPGNEDYQRLTIHNGDWVSTDGESYWTSQWFDPTKTDIVTFTANSPIDGVKGNHDNLKIKDPDGNSLGGFSATFPKYFPFPYPNATPNPYNPAQFNNLYWSFDYGPVHFTMVDEYSSFAPGSAQYNWLVNDLATTTKPWKILMYHEPSYSAGKDGDNVAVRALEPLITQYNVDLVYAGHSHNYARTGAYTLAQANGDQIALNVPHITSGGGGAPVYQPDMTNTGKFPHVITAWPAMEFMTFDIEGKTLTMTAYQVNNASITAIQPSSALTLSPIETIVLNHFTDVSSQISTQRTAFVYDKKSGLYTGRLIITNNGPALTGTIDVVLDGIVNLQGIGNADNQYSTTVPPIASKIAQNTGLTTDVTLVNATGSNDGEPMIKATTNGLAAGAELVIPLQFSMDPSAESINPNDVGLNFTPVILQE